MIIIKSDILSLTFVAHKWSNGLDWRNIYKRDGLCILLEPISPFNLPILPLFLWPILDSIAVSVFVVILVEFDKYWIWDEQACLTNPIKHKKLVSPWVLLYWVSKRERSSAIKTTLLSLLLITSTQPQHIRNPFSCLVDSHLWQRHCSSNLHVLNKHKSWLIETCNADQVFVQVNICSFSPR